MKLYKGLPLCGLGWEPRPPLFEYQHGCICFCLRM
nr:MAG TPA: hypothetical protein [Caudoviricetes sp.]